MTPSGKLSRRGFLVAITGSAIAAAVGCRPSGLAAPASNTSGSGLRLASTPGAVGTASAAPDANYGAVTYDKIILTKSDDLYVTQYDYSRTPELDAKTWSLRVDGLVENPITLDYAAVKAFPAFEDMRTLECIGNPVGGDLIGNLVWKGFHFDEILKQVQVQTNATHARFEAADGYSTSVALEWLTQPNVMLAYEMNGQPLTVIHGFPLRINMPGLYGQKMPRWITHIEFIDHYYKGFWESTGWSDVASVQTNSIIQSPPDGYQAAVGSTLAIQGVAFAGKRKITGVDVQIDDGEWTPANLTHGSSALAWTQWYLTWTPPAPGDYRIAVRAIDETGKVQSGEVQDIFYSGLAGAYAIHKITVSVT